MRGSTTASELSTWNARSTAQCFRLAWSSRIIPAIPDTTSPGARTGRAFFVSWELATRPAEIYQWPGATRWTFTGDLPAGLVEPEETSYTSFDGLTVPSIFYKVDDAPRPAVVYFHGGPEGQSRGGYLPAAQLL